MTMNHGLHAVTLRDFNNMTLAERNNQKYLKAQKLTKAHMTSLSNPAMPHSSNSYQVVFRAAPYRAHWDHPVKR